jgi:hypothetical protein
MRWCSRCGSHAAVQREAGGNAANGLPNLRCPRNGKRTNFPQEIPFHHMKPLGASEQRAWEGDWNDPPARIPANTVAARPEERAVVTPNALAGTPVRVFETFPST